MAVTGAVLQKHLLENSAGAMQGDFSSWLGGGQVVVHDSAAGMNYGASSPRKDGAAVPEAPDYFGSDKAKGKNQKAKGKS